MNERKTKPGQRGSLTDRLEKLSAYGMRCDADKLCAYPAHTRLTYINDEKPDQGEKTGQYCNRHGKFYERPPLRVLRSEDLGDMPQTGKQWQKP